MINLAAVFLGGGTGALLRHLICSYISNHWAVMFVNVTGAFLIGVAFSFFVSKSHLQPELRNFIITGLLGGFTTFSTYLLDFSNLINHKHFTEAWLYLLGSIILGLTTLVFGCKIGKLLF